MFGNNWIYWKVELLQHVNPFNSYEWPRQTFPLQYKSNINQISDEKKEKCQLGVN